MLMKCFLVLACVATSSAYKLPTMSRREVFSRVAGAAVPLAAIAQQASAASSTTAKFTGPNGESSKAMPAPNGNTILGTSNKPANTGGFKAEAVTEGVGRYGIAIDEAGAALPTEGSAMGYRGKSAGSVTEYASKVSTLGQDYKSSAAMARLMSR